MEIVVYSYNCEQVFTRIAVFGYLYLVSCYVCPSLLVLQLLGEVGAYHHLFQTVAVGVEATSLLELYVQHIKIVGAGHIKVDGIKQLFSSFRVNNVVAAST